MAHFEVDGRYLTNVTSFYDTEYYVHGRGTNVTLFDGHDIGPKWHGSYVSYQVFWQAYWPHFSQSLTKGLGELRSSRDF
jgi:prepilin-type processing-associated H-X9-DG protein